MKNTEHHKFCAKCGNVLGVVVVKGFDGREFCGVGCRVGYYAEMRREMVCRFDEWVGDDDGNE